MLLLRDTNERYQQVAHKILKTFGSLPTLLEADPQDIKKEVE